ENRMLEIIANVPGDSPCIEENTGEFRKIIERNLEKTAVSFEKERQNYQEVILKQQLTIDALLELVAKREK
ncbi:MAG: hypothetical protein O0W93_00360, partial [Methanocorpusculum sp.]|nr:hypothetical protein [Methanocorpusculum sp.]